MCFAWLKQDRHGTAPSGQGDRRRGGGGDTFSIGREDKETDRGSEKEGREGKEADRGSEKLGREGKETDRGSEKVGREGKETDRGNKKVG